MLQMGLHILSVDGMRINKLCTYSLKCKACYRYSVPILSPSLLPLYIHYLLFPSINHPFQNNFGFSDHLLSILRWSNALQGFSGSGLRGCVALQAPESKAVQSQRTESKLMEKKV